MADLERPDNVVSLFGHRAPIPPPNDDAPPFVDPRQARTRRILENIGGALGGAMSQSNLGTGFAASAPDLGRLQELLEQPLRSMEMAELEDRWADELFPVAEATVLAWVQRVKELSFEVRDNGVHVRLQTQDDLGYYRYAFDVFATR